VSPPFAKVGTLEKDNTLSAINVNASFFMDKSSIFDGSLSIEVRTPL